MVKTTLKSQIVKVDDYKSQPRTQRDPAHPFNLIYRPFEIVPFMIAPVLPGETLVNGFLQSSCVSDKIANRLIGWTHETHVFYVPLRALTQDDAANFSGNRLNSLFLDPTYNLRTDGMVEDANNVPFYQFKGGVPWVEEMYNHVVRRWFRDEDETVLPTWDNYHVAKINQGNVFHSLKEESAGTDDEELPGVDEIEELDILPGFTTHYQQWEFMRDQGMTQLSYADFLRSYGITPPKEVLVENQVEPTIDAEKILSSRKWTNPTLAPQQGEAEHSSVVYWRNAAKITKRMLFAEPGFIFGVKTVRPKIYLGNQKGSASGLLGTPFSWLPAVLNNYGYSSLLEELDSATDGILQGGDEDYWLDIKDLFLHGDQFVNNAMGAAANHGIALPVASNLDKKYLTEAMMNSLFAVTDGSASNLYEDGMANMTILGRIKETSPQQ